MGRLSPAVTVLSLFLTGCGGGATVTVYNGTDAPLTVDGLPGGTVSVPALALHRANVDASVDLKAGEHTAKIPLMAPGGGAVWSIGGTGCFVEADFRQYYEMPPDIPAMATVVHVMDTTQTLHVAAGKVSANPGQRLPKNHPGGAVTAIVQVPCEAATNEAVARAWVEMMLPEFQPK